MVAPRNAGGPRGEPPKGTLRRPDVGGGAPPCTLHWRTRRAKPPLSQLPPSKYSIFPRKISVNKTQTACDDAISGFDFANFLHSRFVSAKSRLFPTGVTNEYARGGPPPPTPEPRTCLAENSLRLGAFSTRPARKKIRHGVATFWTPEKPRSVPGRLCARSPARKNASHLPQEPERRRKGIDYYSHQSKLLSIRNRLFQSLIGGQTP